MRKLSLGGFVKRHGHQEEVVDERFLLSRRATPFCTGEETGLAL
jgi:hypothetical protein